MTSSLDDDDLSDNENDLVFQVALENAIADDSHLIMPDPVVIPAQELAKRRALDVFLKACKTVISKGNTKSNQRLVSSNLTKFRTGMDELDKIVDRRFGVDAADPALREQEMNEWFDFQIAAENDYQQHYEKLNEWRL